MGDKSKISWTDATWQVTTGCTKVSPGCANCYAERLAAGRLAHLPQYKDLMDEWGHWTSEVRCHSDLLDQPLHWRRPRMIFVNSMSDLFHPKVPIAFVDDVFDIMAKTPQHCYQILTKRPGRMMVYMQSMFPRERLLPNVWLGTSVENQATAEERIPLLLQVPAAVRWVSAEPLLESIDLTVLSIGDEKRVICDSLRGEEFYTEGQALPPMSVDRIRWREQMRKSKTRYWRAVGSLAWCVCGGESGPNARPMEIAWLADIVSQCQAASVPVFIKQDSGLYPGMQGRIPDELWALKQYPVCVPES